MGFGAEFALAVLSADTAGGWTAPEPISPPQAADPPVRGTADLLGVLRAKGEFPELGAYATPRQTLYVYLDRVALRPGLHEITLPWRGTTLLTAHPARMRCTWRKAVDAPWVCTVERDGRPMVLSGRWVLLAQLGRLAGWPEPR